MNGPQQCYVRLGRRINFAPDADLGVETCETREAGVKWRVRDLVRPTEEVVTHFSDEYNLHA